MVFSLSVFSRLPSATSGRQLALHFMASDKLWDWQIVGKATRRWPLFLKA